MKKIIALFLTLILCISYTALADMSEVKKDLTDYKIITNYDIETINRAEAVKIILTMLGYGECEKCETAFTDVDKEYWASGYIDTAYRLGIINGVGNDKFAPEKKLSYEQIVKMLVCALGYGPSVQVPYPVGHFQKANSLGILKGLSLTGSDAAKREDVAVMVYNALDVPIMVQQGYGNNATYIILDGKKGVEKITLRIKLNNI